MSAYDDYNTEKAVSKGFSGFINKAHPDGQFIDVLSGEHRSLRTILPRW